jgi:hypothetical protein
MDWDLIEPNKTEMRSNTHQHMFKQQRIELSRYVMDEYDDLFLQASCGLHCEDCFPAMVLECWWSNKTRNKL